LSCYRQPMHLQAKTVLTEELYFILMHSLGHSHPKERLQAGAGGRVRGKQAPRRARRLETLGTVFHSFTCAEVIM